MRTRFQERPAAQQRGRGFMIALGLLGIGMTLVFVAIGFNAPNSIPGRGYYNLQAEFTDADNIAPHAQVRLGGKIVGQVLNPRVDDGKAVVDLQIDPKYKPLKSDSVVEVRPRSAVGVRYVDIRSGKSGEPLPEGATIPSSQTKATRALDEVLGTFDPETRVKTQQFLREFGKGMAARGEDLNETIGAAPDMLRGTDEVLGAIADRQDAAGNFVRGSAIAAASADPVREQIRLGFAPEAKALRPFSDRGDELRATLDAAPGTFSTMSSRLPSVDALVKETEGFAARMRPVLKAGPGAFGQTAALLREARPGLRDADATLRLADRAVIPTLELLDTTRPLLPQLESTLDNAKPTVERLGRYGCDFIEWGRRWTDALAWGNAQGGYLRFNVITPSPESVTGLEGAAAAIGATGTNRSPYPPPCTSNTETPSPTGGTVNATPEG
ncbi:MlaD family protein [Paraconexibacter sp.]|uniref:MlaD family protein n=1 Tax=Paraconexibacter sp. TaxID=2949640 RepID=UPI00356A2E9A